MLKKCKECEKDYDTDFFYFNKFFNRYYYVCKACHRKIVRKYPPINPPKRNIEVEIRKIKKYRLSSKGKSAVIRASKKSYLNHKEKWMARAKTRYAVSKGIILKPKNCEDCGEVKPLQGHHTDYSKPLEVKWLCSGCHAKIHKLLKLQS